MKNIKKLEALTDEDFERETPTSIYITTFIGMIFFVHYFSEDHYHNKALFTGTLSTALIYGFILINFKVVNLRKFNVGSDEKGKDYLLNGMYL